MDISNAVNSTISAIKKIKSVVSIKHFLIMVVMGVLLMLAAQAFAFTEHKDGSLTLTATEVKAMQARFALAVNAIQQLQAQVNADAAQIEELQRKITVGPDKTCL